MLEPFLLLSNFLLLVINRFSFVFPNIPRDELEERERRPRNKKRKTTDAFHKIAKDRKVIPDDSVSKMKKNY